MPRTDSIIGCRLYPYLSRPNFTVQLSSVQGRGDDLTRPAFLLLFILEVNAQQRNSPAPEIRSSVQLAVAVQWKAIHLQKGFIIMSDAEEAVICIRIRDTRNWRYVLISTHPDIHIPCLQLNLHSERVVQSPFAVLLLLKNDYNKKDWRVSLVYDHLSNPPITELCTMTLANVHSRSCSRLITWVAQWLPPEFRHCRPLTCSFLSERCHHVCTELFILSVALPQF